MIQGHPIKLALAILMAWICGHGCAGPTPQVANPIPIAMEEYPSIFDSAMAVLQEAGFSIDRRDRRFGVVTTQPQLTPTVFEPWKPDYNLTDHHVQSTVNFQRRVIRVGIEQALGGATAESLGKPVTEAGPNLVMRVTVTIYQQQHPEIPPPNTVVSTVSFTDGKAGRSRAVVSERGVEKPFWQAAGRDENLEKHLVAMILKRSIHTQGQKDKPAPPEPTPGSGAKQAPGDSGVPGAGAAEAETSGVKREQ